MKNFLIGLVTGAIIAAACSYWFAGRHPKLTTPYQAVLLDDNQVFYGKLSAPFSPNPVLTEVFYIKSGTDPQTKEVKSVLVKRGKELHGPDRMYLNERHVVLIEPVSPNSQVAKLIDQSSKE